MYFTALCALQLGFSLSCSRFWSWYTHINGTNGNYFCRIWFSSWQPAKKSKLSNIPIRFWPYKGIKHGHIFIHTHTHAQTLWCLHLRWTLNITLTSNLNYSIFLVYFVLIKPEVFLYGDDQIFPQGQQCKIFYNSSKSIQ